MTHAATSDPTLRDEWVTKANEAQDEAELGATWKAGVAAIKAAKDMPAYEAFKKAVAERGSRLKAEAQE